MEKHTARIINLKDGDMDKVEAVMENVDFTSPMIARQIREALGLSQYDMAELLDCSQPTVSRAERGLSEKNLCAELEFLLKVIDVLDGPDKYLVLTTAGLLAGVVKESKAFGKSFMRERYNVK